MKDATRMLCPIPLGILVSLIVLAPTLGAQGSSTRAISDDPAAEWSTRWNPASPCIAAIPVARMRLVPVFLHSTISDSGVSALAVQADLMAHDVAHEMRAALGGDSSDLPIASARATTASVPSELIITMHRDGAASTRAMSQSGDTSATTMLAAAFDSARKRGEALVLWPNGYEAESLVVRLVLMPSRFMASPIDPNGVVVAYESTHSQFGVFRVPEPQETPVLARLGNPPPRYPKSLESRNERVELLMQFVVDSTGRAERETIHDVWPAYKPRLAGYLARDYQAFVAATRDALVNWKFYPARVDACPVRQLMRMPIAFEPAGYR